MEKEGKEKKSEKGKKEIQVQMGNKGKSKK